VIAVSTATTVTLVLVSISLAGLALVLVPSTLVILMLHVARWTERPRTLFANAKRATLDHAAMFVPTTTLGILIFWAASVDLASVTTI